MAVGGSQLMQAYVALATDRSRLASELSQARSMVADWATNTARMTASLLAINFGGGLIAQIKNVGSAFISANAQMETYLQSLGVLLQSEAQAKELFSQIQKLAAVTPFTTASLTQAITQLKVFGFETQQLIPMIKVLGNAAAASPLGMVSGVQRLSYAFGQIKSSGRAMAHELREISMAGVPVWQILAEQSGKSVAQMRDFVHKGALDADTAIAMLTAGMEKRYGGMMEKQSRTWTGMMSTLSDNAQIFAQKIGQPFFEFAKMDLTKLVTGFDTSTASAMVDDLRDKVAVLTGYLQKSQSAVVDFVSTNRTAIVSTSAAAAGFLSWAVVLPRLASGMSIVGVATKSVAIGAPGAGMAIRGLAMSLKAPVVAAQGLLAASRGVGAGLGTLVSGVGGAVSRIPGLTSGFRLLMSGARGALGGITALVTKIPGMSVVMRTGAGSVRVLTSMIPGLSTAVKLLTTSLRMLTFSNPITGIIAVVGIGVIAFIKWRKEIMAFLASQDKLGAIAGVLKTAWASLKAIGESLWSGVKSVAESFWGWLQGVIESNRGEWAQWGDLAGETCNNLWDTAKGIFGALKEMVGGALSWIGGKWNETFGTTINGSIDGTVKSGFHMVKNFLEWASLLSTNWGLTWELIKTAAAQNLTMVADKGIMVFNTLVAAATAGGIAMWEKMKEFAGNIVTIFSSVGRTIRGLFIGLWEGIKNKFSGGDFMEGFKKQWDAEISKIADDPKAANAAKVFSDEFGKRMGAEHPLQATMDQLDKDRAAIEQKMLRARDLTRQDRADEAKATAAKAVTDRDAAAKEMSDKANRMRAVNAATMAVMDPGIRLKGKMPLNSKAQEYANDMKARRDAYAAAHPKAGKGRNGVAGMADQVAANQAAANENVAGHKGHKHGMETMGVAEYANKIQSGLGQSAGEKAQVQVAKDIKDMKDNGIKIKNPGGVGGAKVAA